MFDFAWPWMMLMLPLPWLVWRFMSPANQMMQGVLYAPFVAIDQRENVTSTIAGTRKRFSLLFWGAVICWFLLMLAIARPQWLGEAIELPETGRNLLLAVDVSGSMEIVDMDDGRSNRLEVVKQVAGDFIQRREGDRIGLILFGTHAYLQAPLTFDHTTVNTLLQETVIGIAGRETAIGDAIGMALKRLRKASGETVLVLLTDGANTSGQVSPGKAAELAKQQNLRIYTIGVGGGPREVPGIFGTQIVNTSSDLDEESLQAIADMTGGQFFRATDRKTLEAIYHQLDEIEPALKGSRLVRPVTELYIWPLGASLLLSFILAIFAWRKVVSYG